MHVPALDRRAAVAIALAAIAVLLALVSLSMQAPCTHPDLGILEAPVLEEAEGGIVIPPALALFESRGSHGIRSFQPPRTREGMGRSLQEYGARVGVELGVQGGEFAASILPAWRNCTRYYLVDAWQPLANYTDQSNVDRWRQVELFESARARMRRFRRRTLALFLPMLTSQALLLVPDGSVDLVYVDARHDYCGVLADVRGWWPKLRPGGIMAGHDYLTVAESRALNPKQDWGLCGDGTRHEGAVKAAVQGFAAEQGGLDIMVTKDDVWPTWMVQKRRERGAAAK